MVTGQTVLMPLLLHCSFHPKQPSPPISFTITVLYLGPGAPYISSKYDPCCLCFTDPSPSPISIQQLYQEHSGRISFALHISKKNSPSCLLFHCSSYNPHPHQPVTLLYLCQGDRPRTTDVQEERPLLSGEECAGQHVVHAPWDSVQLEHTVTISE